jgi:biotin carboxylase
MEGATSNHKVLIILPNHNDRVEALKFDPSKYEVHFLHATVEVKDTMLGTFEYAKFLAQPGFLISCVNRAVRYAKENAITAIMFGNDLSSIVASVVCQITGMRGPSLISTFLCLHKYYSRKACEDNRLWVDYINLDDSVEKWRHKVKYPCFLKPPFLTQSKGMSVIRNESELLTAIFEVRPLVTPFFQGYCELFQKYLDLDQFPLAVQNIMIIEELVESLDQFAIGGWVDIFGNFFALQSWDIKVSPKKQETFLGCVTPIFSETEETVHKMAEFVQEVVKKFRIRSTCITVEFWKNNESFLLVEINCRCASSSSECQKRLMGTSTYEIAVLVACGDFVALQKKQARLAYEDGQAITGVFRVYTWGEGKADKLFDFQYARNGSIQDGVFNTTGPGAKILVSENSSIKQISANGCQLARYSVVENSVDDLFARVKLVGDKLLLRQNDRDMIIYSTP